MSVQVKHRRESAAFLATFVGAQGELLVDTTNNRVQVHDGATPGGFPAARMSDLAGLRNRIRNGNFAVNQRAVSGAVTLAAGAYGHDGVKAGAAGATYTFAASGIDTVLTITAGSLILPIEGSLIEGGLYRVSQGGTAQARVWQGTGSSGSGSYAAVPFTTAALAAATQTNVEFSTGTVSLAQCEPGTVATAFERRPPSIELALCQRYYETCGIGVVVTAISSGTILLGVRWSTPKRAGPTVGLITATFYFAYNASACNVTAATIAFANTDVTGARVNINGTLSSYSVGAPGFIDVSVLSASAEL